MNKENKEIKQYFESIDYEYSWDYSERDRETWHEILKDGKLIAQFDMDVPLEVIKTDMCNLHLGLECSDSGFDYKLNGSGTKEFRELMKSVYDECNLNYKLNGFHEMSTAYKERKRIMKMYYFSQGGYGMRYHVMAKSKDAALDYFKKFMKKKLEKNSYEGDWYETNIRSEIDFFTKNPERIFEYEEGEFVQTEVC